MPPIRDHDVPRAPAADDLDDDMPPLLDMPPLVAPPPDMPSLVEAPPMTYTFLADMTPYAPDHAPPAPEAVHTPLSPATPLSLAPSPPPSPPDTPRGNHGKRRAASYIPRPPNAFILFRSSFIRAQHVPGAVEGNHSTLSKIIGRCWRALPPEERAQWEARALVAQAEHRRRYPDWRFRPGAAEGPPPPRKKRRPNRPRPVIEPAGPPGDADTRVHKIADLLVAGTTGPALEAAVEQWEGTRGHRRGRGRGIDMGAHRDIEAQGASEASTAVATPAHAESSRAVHVTESLAGPTAAWDAWGDALSDGESVGTLTPARGSPVRTPPPPPPDARVPLTALYKRSLSAPASHARASYGAPLLPPTPARTHTHVRRDTISLPPVAPSPGASAFPALAHSELAPGPAPQSAPAWYPAPAYGYAFPEAPTETRAPAPAVSSFSTLTGWAGDPRPARALPNPALLSPNAALEWDDGDSWWAAN